MVFEITPSNHHLPYRNPIRKEETPKHVGSDSALRIHFVPLRASPPFGVLVLYSQIAYPIQI